jgi:hypothetical protein
MARTRAATWRGLVTGNDFATQSSKYYAKEFVTCVGKQIKRKTTDF